MYGTRLINMTINFAWNNDLNRLVLGIDSTPESKRSKFMASMRTRQKHKKDVKIKKKEIIEDERTEQEQWFDKLSDVQDYIERNNQLPSKKSKNGVTRQMREWIETQRDDYEVLEGFMKNAEVVKCWDRFTRRYGQYFYE